MTVGLLHHVEFVNVMHKILVTHCVAGVGRERTIQKGANTQLHLPGSHA